MQVTRPLSQTKRLSKVRVKNKSSQCSSSRIGSMKIVTLGLIIVQISLSFVGESPSIQIGIFFISMGDVRM
jgi:hypothetical protein